MVTRSQKDQGLAMVTKMNAPCFRYVFKYLKTPKNT